MNNWRPLEKPMPFVLANGDTLEIQPDGSLRRPPRRGLRLWLFRLRKRILR